MYYLIFVTPFLGLFRNYAKYKNVNITLFFRTPIMVFLIYKIINNYGYEGEKYFYLSLITERWILLTGKGIYSYLNNDNIKKKKKYQKKYGIKYNKYKN